MRNNSFSKFHPATCPFGLTTHMNMSEIAYTMSKIQYILFILFRASGTAPPKGKNTLDSPQLTSILAKDEKIVTPSVSPSPLQSFSTLYLKALAKRNRKSTQVNASLRLAFDLRSTCISFGHPLAWTCDDLR